MNVTAILPLKAHSERIPRKNFRTWFGRPLYQQMLNMLVSSSFVDQVVLNTDADIDIPQLYFYDGKAVFQRRSPDLRGDDVSMNRIIRQVVDEYPSDVYLQTHATNPLLTAGTIARAIQDFDCLRRKGIADSTFSADVVQARAYLKSLDQPLNHFGSELSRTQDLDPIIVENSALFLFTRESFEATGSRIGLKPAWFPIPRWEAIDIDTEEDWKLAEFVAKGMQRHEVHA